jgi:hypothetical protein
MKTGRQGSSAVSEPIQAPLIPIATSTNGPMQQIDAPMAESIPASRKPFPLRVPDSFRSVIFMSQPAEGVYWHPVGAEDRDLLVTPAIFPLAEAFAAVRRAFERETTHRRRLATIFNCA